MLARWMKPWFDRVMARRAAGLTGRLRKWIPEGSRVADVGSGTGHNADCWRTMLRVVVDEFDVADLHWVGPGPMLFDGRRLPAPDAAYDVVTLLFVLHYTPQSVELLTEVRRIARGPVLLVQSTCRGPWGRFCLSLRELCWGPLAFHVARLSGIIRGQPCPLNSRTLYSFEELMGLIQRAGLRVLHWEPQPWRGFLVSRDLFVLEPMPEHATCRSSSRPAMKCGG
jgi:SAM-dependent methyltransferase